MLPSRRWWGLAAACLFVLYLLGLSRVGLLGPDEPRYAWIGRAMAQSGDWLTPRLYGEPWFEKPPLLYWLIGAGYRLGLNDDWAPRLLVALLSVAFLPAYARLLADEWGARSALVSTLLLATSAGWLVYGQIAVTDAPLAAFFSLFVLLALRARRMGDRAAWLLAGACLGLAMLAKGLVPVALALPAVVMLWRSWRGWAIVLAGTLTVAGPWYGLSLARHGREFVNEFFWKHHLSRFAEGSLQHVQPFWFYGPVLAGLLFPWTPLLALLGAREAREAVRDDLARRVLAAVVLFGFLFFSAATNKLPGYLLPLLPLLCALMGTAWQPARTGIVLALCAALVGLVPSVALILPEAMTRGLGRAVSSAALAPGLGFGTLVAYAIYRWAHRHPDSTLVGIAVAVVLAVAALKLWTYPELDSTVSVRHFWRKQEAALRQEPPCVAQLHRSLVYGLAFYSGQTWPSCDETESVSVREIDGKLSAIRINLRHSGEKATHRTPRVE